MWWGELVKTGGCFPIARGLCPLTTLPALAQEHLLVVWVLLSHLPVWTRI